MSDSVIRVENLGKRYVLSHQQARGGQRFGYKRFSDVLLNAAKAPLRRLRALRTLSSDLRPPSSDKEDFWALKDVSFEIKRGEVVGIIGRNGAGKSTLLKILSRITEPTTGRIELDGRVASLLEVGTGFHPELTGRENIYLNGAILGMSRFEIKSKFDEIVAFAETEKFLDTPVKHYSSGMYVRLAFAVAAHLEPEILVVDEVLAVGDAQFQKKCLGKMGNVAGQGRTVLLVSHNMSSVRYLCSRGIYLEKGRVGFTGGVEECIAQYLKTSEEKPSLNLKNRTGDGRLQFTDFWLEDNLGNRTGVVLSGEPCVLAFSYRSNGGDLRGKVDVGFGLHSPAGDRLLLLYASHLDQAFEAVESKGVFRCKLPGLPLASGRYSVFPRIEISGREADYPREGIGWIDVEEYDFYGTGKKMGQHGHAHAPFLIKGEWSNSRLQ